MIGNAGSRSARTLFPHRRESKYVATTSATTMRQMMISAWMIVVMDVLVFHSISTIQTTLSFTVLVNPTHGGHSRIGGYGKSFLKLRYQTASSNLTDKVPTPSLPATKETTTAFANGIPPPSTTNHQQLPPTIPTTVINGYDASSLSHDNDENDVPLSMDNIESTWYESQGQHLDSDINSKIYTPLVNDGILPTADPAQIEFVTPDIVLSKDNNGDNLSKASEKAMIDAWMSDMSKNTGGHYPFAAMMQGSGRYIANHAGKVAVFHLPGDILDAGSSTTKSTAAQKQFCDSLLQDIALCWLLDMKIVIVVAVQYATAVQNTNHHHGNGSIGTEPTTYNNSNINHMSSAHECHNALKVTSLSTLRDVEEEAGFLRTELERKLNRCLRVHIGLGDHNTNRPPEGNVVSGNFYTAHRFGTVRGVDYEYTGYASETHTKNIRQVLDKNDIVLLSTIGLSTMGELVNVNGYHLAATVAASLQASKVIYIASQGSVLRSKKDQTPIQELPVSFAESITAYHQVTCSSMGFATFQNAKEKLKDSSAVELLLHMAWSCWSVKNGTSRAHICNPSDGSVLEELFTAKNGANTCIYHDDEISSLLSENASQNNSLEDHTTPKDWDDFFASASAQGQTIEYFM